MAWAGFSLGADRWLSFALRQPAWRPRALVRIAGGPVAELAALTNGAASALLPDLPVLLVHGAQDEVFPLRQLTPLAERLREHGAKVETWTLDGAEHDLGQLRGVAFRRVGEWCRRQMGLAAWRAGELSVNQWRAQATPLWVWWLPAGAWLAGGWMCRRRGGEEDGGWKVEDGRAWGLRLLAGLLGGAAVGVTGVHLLLPRLPATERTRTLAQRFLVSTAGRADFAWLAGQPACAGWRIGALREVAELAAYNRSLVNWTFDDVLYGDFVLSPVLSAGVTAEPGDWRRPLWESLYPRVRRESSPAEAVVVVVRHLRERISVASGAGAGSVAADWRRQLTDGAGWEQLGVAALRAVGIPARLRAGRAEFWDGAAWRAVPAAEVTYRQ